MAGSLVNDAKAGKRNIVNKVLIFSTGLTGFT
jgi:hypothetical protein